MGVDSAAGSSVAISYWVLSFTSVLSCWLVSMPLSESRRVLERYNRTQAVGEGRQLDLIVLGRGPLDRSLAPPRDEFELVFENTWFRVYARTDMGAT